MRQELLALSADARWFAIGRPDAARTTPDDMVTYQSILFGVLHRRGTELSVQTARDVGTLSTGPWVAS